MCKTAILLDSVDKVKKFVSIMAKFDAKADLRCGRYVIDAKSIVGIFSLDLSKPIILTIHEDEKGAEEIVGAIKEYIAN